jgi:hypothetical protein
VKQYRFEKTLKVAGRLRAAGDVVPATDIPAGSLEPLLRLGHVVEHDPAEAFAALMAGGPVRGDLATLPDGFPATRSGPTDEDMRAAIAEIDRLRTRVAELDAAAAKPTDPPAAPVVAPAGAAAEDLPVEGKAKAPAIGPSKPPELKAGKK